MAEEASQPLLPADGPATQGDGADDRSSAVAARLEAGLSAEEGAIDFEQLLQYDPDHVIEYLATKGTKLLGSFVTEVGDSVYRDKPVNKFEPPCSTVRGDSPAFIWKLARMGHPAPRFCNACWKSRMQHVLVPPLPSVQDTEVLPLLRDGSIWTMGADTMDIDYECVCWLSGLSDSSRGHLCKPRLHLDSPHVRDGSRVKPGTVSPAEIRYVTC